MIMSTTTSSPILVLAHGGITAPTFRLVTACYCDCWGWGGGRGGGGEDMLLRDNVHGEGGVGGGAG